ncbi:unnamed protein product [Chrysodeixis includens]|uniref:Uncharacterized protein n=1 Tax=Chrysodeixis includens TaxID=689277 RepID=A0A9N8Q0P2_CHRIL|nr:unnamed protein product [Chrysodeixis includens]
MCTQSILGFHIDEFSIVLGSCSKSFDFMVFLTPRRRSRSSRASSSPRCRPVGCRTAGSRSRRQAWARCRGSRAAPRRETRRAPHRLLSGCRSICKYQLRVSTTRKPVQAPGLAAPPTRARACAPCLRWP